VGAYKNRRVPSRLVWFRKGREYLLEEFDKVYSGTMWKDP